MPRNMDKRVEAVWPVEEEHLKAKVMEILSYSLKDNTKAHVMRSDGTYVQASPVRNKNFRSQDKMIEFARTESQATLRLRESMRQIELSTQKGESADIFPMRMSK